jgi:two-component system, NtrC family, sensor histidine kinase HydH
MGESAQSRFNRLDLLWLAFLAGLAVLPPIGELHKQLTLAAIAILQLLEREFLVRWPRSGRSLVLLLKTFLATLLIAHTGNGPSINSSYWPIYFVPVVTAAMYFGVWATLGWTLLASATYCSYLYPALQEYQLTSESIGLLGIRVLFFFLAAMIVNRFAVENREQTRRYQLVAAELAETNRQLQRAQAEARRSERLAALGQLSAGLAHEIRNPLGVIKGSAEMLNQKLQDSNPLASELAGYISSEVNRLSVLVTRFLNFARPLRAELAPHNISDLLDHAAGSVREASVRNPGQVAPVTVQKNYAADLPLVPLDEALFEQAFINLVQNAYEAMGERGGTLHLEVVRSHQNGHAGVEVRVKDSGPGVPAELREQIFNPFVTTKASGVGLGLSIVSKIVDEHRGTIRVESSPGDGTCFIVFFPLQEEVAQLNEATVAR